MIINNTLTKKEEEFVPLHNNRVNMYVCGVTVYDYTHIGHARTYVFFDVLRRYLESKGHSVFYVQNITDIDDKIIKRAKETKTTEKELADRFIKEMFVDMDNLKIKRASIYPRATEHINEMILFIEKLIKQNKAYVSNGDVYFDVSSFNAYGKLSNLSKDKLLSEESENKKNAGDFALWKKQKTGEPAWDSPWGLGRPGWHIECSVMSQTYLGDTLDIHGGARDLIFPHHENEIAQSEACTGEPFVRYWIHTGFLNVNGEKMSKSLGNFITIRDALKKWSAETLRFFFINHNYGSPIDFSEKAIEEANISLNKIQRTYEWLKNAENANEGNDEIIDEKINKLKNEFVSAMENNINTREAIIKLFEVCDLANRYITNPKKSTIKNFLNFFEYVNSIFQIITVSTDDKTSQLVEILLSLRIDAKNKKDFATSDKIRNELKKQGIEVQDTKDGQKWNLIK